MNNIINIFKDIRGMLISPIMYKNSIKSKMFFNCNLSKLHFIYDYFFFKKKKSEEVFEIVFHHFFFFNSNLDIT